MSEYAIEKRKVSKTIDGKMGWRLGYGYKRERISGSYACWCILQGGKIIAEARSKSHAENICHALTANITRSGDT